jgi:hypothetical protein
MPRQIRTVAPIVAVAVATLCPTATTVADKPPEPVRPITLAELSERQILGSLGHPLGTLLTVEGVVADGTYTKLKYDAGHTLLRVQVVEGKELKDEVVFHFDAFLDWVEKPKVGSRFKYFGYETGGFIGVPAKSFDGIGPAVPRFGFVTKFAVLREVANAK